MNSWWVPPSTREIKHVVFDFLNRYARVILNKVKELSCYESKIILRTTKVPHLLKGKFRDDIGFLIEIYFLKRCAGIIPAYRLTDNAAQNGEAHFFYPPRLHRPLITVPPALTGAAITVLAFAEPFIASGAAVGFLVLFSYRKRTRPPRL
jgi:hypothetical protein